ncbi:MAG: membrane protein insertase YidC [Candidatus Coatesbacteria bacterium]|nr:membrane protein insertase YidC [Candidatus Coatesbacteria bacterium]
MENRRLILAVVLSIAVFIVWSYLFGPKTGPKAPDDAVKKEAPAAEEPGTDAVKQFVERSRAGAQAETLLSPDAAEVPEREITVDTDLFRVVFSSSGGSIKSLRLRQYKDLPAEFITAKEKHLRKLSDGRVLNELERSEANRDLSDVIAEFRQQQAVAGEESSDDVKERLGALSERYGELAAKLSHADFVDRRAKAKRIRESLSGGSGLRSEEVGHKLELLEGVELVPPYLSAVGENMLRTVRPVSGSHRAQPSFETVQFDAKDDQSVTSEVGSIRTVRFEAGFNDGAVKLVKEYKVVRGSYAIDVSLDVETAPGATPGLLSFETVVGPDVGSSGMEPKGRYSSGGVVASEGKHLLDRPFGLTDELAWAGLQDRYFLVSLLSKTPMLVRSESFLQGFNLRWIAPLANEGASEVRVFAGPKAPEELEKQGHGLKMVLDFGWLSLIAGPMYDLLKFLYAGVGNYGLAIVILSLLIKAVFYPLTRKQTKSMKKMQGIQPEMKRLREKYKDDKQRLNQELMALYKEHEVNPMGGCLPMLIQFPFLIALIRVLPIVIELRQAPFILWLNDLSEPDPYYVTPILMGAAMILQQKMTPASDPKQARMMMMMSVVFTFFFLNFSSGLVLYWLTGTLVSVAQQYITKVREDRAKASAEK